MTSRSLDVESTSARRGSACLPLAQQFNDVDQPPTWDTLSINLRTAPAQS